MADEQVISCDRCNAEREDPNIIVRGKKVIGGFQGLGEDPEETEFYRFDGCPKHDIPLRDALAVLRTYGVRLDAPPTPWIKGEVVGGTQKQLPPPPPPRLPNGGGIQTVTPPAGNGKAKPIERPKEFRNPWADMVYAERIRRGPKCTNRLIAEWSGVPAGTIGSMYKIKNINASIIEAVTKALDLNRDEVFRLTGVQVERGPRKIETPPPPKNETPKPAPKPTPPPSAPKPRYSNFYEWMEIRAKEIGYASMEEYVEASPLSLSTIEPLKVRLPRKTTLQIIADSLKGNLTTLQSLKTALRAYADLKNRGSLETETMPLEAFAEVGVEVKKAAKVGKPREKLPDWARAIRYKCRTCDDGTARTKGARDQHLRTMHRGKKLHDLLWDLVGMPEGVEPAYCKECLQEFPHPLSLRTHAQHTGHDPYSD